MLGIFIKALVAVLGMVAFIREGIDTSGMEPGLQPDGSILWTQKTTDSDSGSGSATSVDYNPDGAGFD